MKLRLISAVVLLSAMAFAVTPQKSTPAERERAVQVIDKLEQSPMDPALKADREWVFQWVKSSDVNALVCSAIIKPLTDQEPSEARNAMMLQNILASAKFSIQHPDKAKDRVQVFQAATQGMLRAYTNLVKKDPSKKNEFLDSLLAKKQKGELDDYIRKGAAECAKHPQTVLEP